MDIEKLKHKEKDLVKKMKDICEKAESESRDLTNEEEASFSELELRVKNVLDKIEKHNKVVELENRMEEPVSKKIETKVEVVSNEREERKISRDFTQAWCKKVAQARLTDEEKRALEVGTAAEGGNVVPSDFLAKLDKLLINISPLRSLANIYNLDRGISIPTHSTAAGVGVRAEEGDGSSGASDPAFGTVALDPHNIYGEVVMSRELKHQSGVNLEAFLLDHLADQINAKEEELIVSGSGSGQPTGLDAITAVGGTNIPTGVTQATLGAVTVAEVENLMYAMPLKYRRGAVVLVNDTMHKTLMQIRDESGSNRSLFSPDPTKPFGSVINGHDVNVTDYLADPDTADGISMLIVNPKYMHIGDFYGGSEMKLIDKDYGLSQTGQEAMVFYKDVGFCMNAHNALVKFTNAAS